MKLYSCIVWGNYFCRLGSLDLHVCKLTGNVLTWSSSLPLVSSVSFSVSEVIFLGLCLTSLILHVMSSVDAQFIEETIFVPLNSFAPLSKISGLYLCGSISGIPILFYFSICLFFHQSHTVLIIVADSKSCSQIPSSPFFFSILLALLSLLPLYISLLKLAELHCALFAESTRGPGSMLNSLPDSIARKSSKFPSVLSR